MQIDKTKAEAIKSVIDKWAENRNIKVKYVVRGGSASPEFGVEADDWGIEVLPQDGWAYLNGYGSLEASTTATSFEEISEAIDRLLYTIKRS